MNISQYLIKTIKSSRYIKILNYFLIITIIITSNNIFSKSKASELYLESIEYVKKHKYEQALKKIEQSVKLEPNNHNYIAYKSHVLRLNKKYKLALNTIIKAINIESNIPWYYIEAVMSSYAVHDLKITKKYAKLSKNFGKQKLGESNYKYLLDILAKLKTYNYNLSFIFNPKHKNLNFNSNGYFCIPIPTSNLPYQNSTYKVLGAENFYEKEMDGYRLLYIKPQQKKIIINSKITKKLFSYKELFQKYNKNKILPKDINKYLKGNDYINKNSKLLRSISNKLKDSSDLITVHNIIKWINTNLKKGSPPRWKNIDDILQNKIFECSSGSLVFVALARSNNIPSRQVWGPINAGSAYSPKNYLKGHVWAEFYLRGVGWIPVEQFDDSSIGMIPISYIRMYTNDKHLYNNIPLGNIITIMMDKKYGDIVKYSREELK